MKPFLKWAGGKSRLVRQIEELMPSSARMIEPFLGSGAVFMGIDRERYLLSDVNPDLINLYGFVKSEGAAFIDTCRQLFDTGNNEVSAYNALRSRFNALPHGDRDRSAIFVYLNRHCFNGLCRFNASGGFNVPFGRSVAPHFPEREMLAFAEKAAKAEFRCQGFAETMMEAEEGDVVYCDPPYVPLSPTASFDAYAAGGFAVERHMELAELCRQLAERGVSVVVSNHLTPFTEELYSDAHIRRIEVRRSISADGGKRTKAAEVLAVFGPHAEVVRQIDAERAAETERLEAEIAALQDNAVTAAEPWPSDDEEVGEPMEFLQAA